jgi:hypothetical protein
MAQKEFKVGDRVVVNERNSTYQGRVGTVKYVSGGQYWVVNRNQPLALLISSKDCHAEPECSGGSS